MAASFGSVIVGKSVPLYAPLEIEKCGLLQGVSLIFGQFAIVDISSIM